MLTENGIAKLMEMKDEKLRGYGLNEALLKDQKYSKVLISQYMINDLEMKGLINNTDMKKASKKVEEKWESSLSKTSYAQPQLTDKEMTEYSLTSPTRKNSTGGTYGN
jgi:hypothetical protein